MRPGFIVAAVAAIAIVIGGLLWYNHSAEQARLEQQRVQQAEVDRQEELAREEALATEQLAAEQAAREAEQAAAEEAAPADPAPDAIPEEDAGVTTGDAIVVGDEITDDTIVVESATEEPVILDADEAATTVDIVNGDEAAAPVTDTAPDVDTAPAVDTGDAGPAGIGTDAEELLTPEGFDAEAVFVLIDNAPQLTDQQRSTLTALTEGAVANPAMVEPAIESIRAALELPPLD